MFNAIQPKTPSAVMSGLQQHGASVGARKLLQWEFRHAREAITSGVYVTLYNDYRKYECARYRDNVQIDMMVKCVFLGSESSPGVSVTTPTPSTS